MLRDRKARSAPVHIASYFLTPFPPPDVAPQTRQLTSPFLQIAQQNKAPLARRLYIRTTRVYALGADQCMQQTLTKFTLRATSAAEYLCSGLLWRSLIVYTYQVLGGNQSTPQNLLNQGKPEVVCPVKARHQHAPYVNQA